MLRRKRLRLPWFVSALLVLLLLGPAHAWVQCDGVDDILTLSGLTPAGTDLTLSAWIYPLTTHGTYGTILDDSTSDQGWWLWTGNFMRAIDPTNQRVTGTTVVTTNAWHHVAAVIVGSTTTLYLDGIPNGTGTASIMTTALMHVCSDTWPFPYWGRLGELTIYGAALTPGEIAHLAGSKTSYPNLTRQPVAYWPMSECSDQTAVNGTAFVDRSGNGRPLTADDGANNAGMTCGNSDFNFPWGPH